MLSRMRSVSVSTELAMPAERACELAQRSAVFRHVVWPLFIVRDRDVPELIEEGNPFSVRLYYFAGLLPGHRHEITVVERGPTLLRTTERGGIIRAWNHTLTFEPLGPGRCRYTDAIDIDAGALTWLPVAFAELMYRWRQRRWRHLAALAA